jgi:hypothetical protein
VDTLNSSTFVAIRVHIADTHADVYIHARNDVEVDMVVVFSSAKSSTGPTRSRWWS